MEQAQRDARTRSSSSGEALINTIVGSHDPLIPGYLVPLLWVQVRFGIVSRPEDSHACATASIDARGDDTEAIERRW